MEFLSSMGRRASTAIFGETSAVKKMQDQMTIGEKKEQRRQEGQDGPPDPSKMKKKKIPIRMSIGRKFNSTPVTMLSFSIS